MNAALFSIKTPCTLILGMKHSHSCQSMPVGPKLSDSCSQESPQLHSDTSKAIETGIVLSIEKTFTCFEKWSLIKQQLKVS